jgi:hypothetical protein
VAWDRTAYRRTVLDPARQAGNVLPASPYQRYGLAADASDATVVAEQIDRVVAYWQELKSGDRVLGPLAARLLSAHDQLIQDGPLTASRLAGLAAQNHQQQRERLAELAAAVANERTHAGPDTVAKLIKALGGSLTQAEVEAALRQANVVVVDAFPVLPTADPQLKSLMEHVDQLGQKLSAELVFGDDVHRGFRVLHGFQLVDGRRLDAGRVERAVKDADALPYSDRANWTQKALRIMRTAASQPGRIDELLLSEVVERLRRFTRHGLSGQRSIATHAIGLGLDPTEAGLLAAALQAEDPIAVVRQQAEEQLKAHRLREAQRVAARLPASDPLWARINEVDAAVTQLSQAAITDRDRGKTETAAEQLARALSLAADDETLAGQLAALPPPAPGLATAQPEGQQVLITWTASPARTGQVRYRVVRRLDRAPVSATDGTPVVIQASECGAADPAPPAGADLYYSVFADRGAEVYSPAAPAAPLRFAPDVAGIEVAEADTAITISWLQPPPATESVDVIRWEQRPGRDDDESSDAGTGTAVPAGLTGFTDHGLVTGTEYRYRITAVYRAADGALRRSGGIVVPAVPTPEPTAVTDLTWEVLAEQGDEPAARVALSWTPPRHGQVRLVRAAHSPGWPAGARVHPDHSALTDIRGQPRPDGHGRAILPARLPSGRHFVTPLTESGRIVVAGCTTEIMLMAPARCPKATRRANDVKLSWVWPDDATDVVIRHPGGETKCSRRAYYEEGGCEVPAGRGEVTLEIIAVYDGASGRMTAPPALVPVPGRPVHVPYSIRKRPLHRTRRVIEISAEEPVQLPPLTIVQTTGRYPPASPAEGERVGEATGQRAGPGQGAQITVTLPHRNSGWLACFIDPQRHDPDADVVVLIQPPPDQMRIP